MKRKKEKAFERMKRENMNRDEGFQQIYQNRLNETSMFAYDQEIFKKEERSEFKHRIFKNLPKLERQIFGHVQSYKVKNMLIKILIEDFPS